MKLIIIIFTLSLLSCSVGFEDKGFERFNKDNQVEIQDIFLAVYTPFADVDPSKMAVNSFTHYEINQVVQDGPIYKLADVQSQIIKKSEVEKSTQTIDFTIIEETAETDGSTPVTKQISKVGYIPNTVIQNFKRSFFKNSSIDTLSSQNEVTFHNLEVLPIDLKLNSTNCSQTESCSFKGYKISFDLVVKASEYVEHHDLQISSDLPYIDFYDFSDYQYFNGLFSHCVKTWAHASGNNYFISLCTVLRDFNFLKENE
ncbi:MAG: hypothetical protein KDD50_13920 [Bdellovibrionales bacterium]|nr:hypothetical protein [Bdellovibrionales bacterium]